MHKITLFLFLAVGSCANTFASAAIMAPFSNDFSSTAAEFSPSLQTQWGLVANKYRNEILASPGADKTSTSLVQFANLGGSPLTANGFSLHSTFTITNSVGDFNSLGFALLASTPNATTNTNPFYVADLYVGGVTENAKLRLAEISTDLTPGLPTTMLDLGKVLTQGISYQLQLNGTYAANGDLNLQLELIGDNDIDSLQATVLAADVLTGDHFGFRDRASGGATSALTVEYDSLSVAAIPEPSSIGFVASSLIAGYAIGRYVRRKMTSPKA